MYDLLCWSPVNSHVSPFLNRYLFSPRNFGSNCFTDNFSAGCFCLDEADSLEGVIDPSFPLEFGFGALGVVGAAISLPGTAGRAGSYLPRFQAGRRRPGTAAGRGHYGTARQDGLGKNRQTDDEFTRSSAAARRSEAVSETTRYEMFVSSPRDSSQKKIPCAPPTPSRTASHGGSATTDAARKT